MTVQVYTARVSYRGPDRLDVTRKSAPPEGLVFAPSWAILRPALDALAVARSMRAAAEHAGTQRPDDAVLAESCVEMERAAEMRESYRRKRAAWNALLARDEVTLCCYCTDPEACHRTLLARKILPCLGAVYVGERGTEAPSARAST